MLALTTLLARVFADGRRGSAFVLTAGYIATAAVAFLNFVVIANLIVDMLYAVVDPRVRLK